MKTRWIATFLGLSLSACGGYDGSEARDLDGTPTSPEQESAEQTIEPTSAAPPLVLDDPEIQALAEAEARAPNPSLASSDVVILETLKGAKRLQISKQVRDQFFGQLETGALDQTPPTDLDEDVEVVVLDTYRGLFDSGLPDWLVMDVLEDHGVVRAEITEEMLDKKFPQEVIDVSAIAEMERIAMEQYGSLSVLAGDTERIDESGLDLNNARRLGLGCGGKWKKIRSVSLSRHISANHKDNHKEKKGAFDVSMDIASKGQGSFDATVQYRLRRNKCTGNRPYNVKFVKAMLDVKLDAETSMGLVGKASYSEHRKLFQGDKIKLWSGHKSWWIYFFYIELDLDLALDYGVDLEVDVKTTFSSKHKTSGKVEARWECDSNKCAKTKDVSRLDFDADKVAEFEVEADVHVTPWADLNLSADVELWKQDVAEAKLGLVAGLPIRYFGYYGTLCGDGNGDGKNERVRASLLDVTAETYGYIEYKTGLGKGKTAFELKLPGFKKAKKDRVPKWHNAKDAKDKIWSKNLFFKDFVGGGSSVLSSPIVKSKTVLTKGARPNLTPRSCYPFDHAPIYEIDWGDGSPVFRGPITEASHDYSSDGDHTLTARIVGDVAGRDFTAKMGTTKTIKSTPPPPPPPPSPYENCYSICGSNPDCYDSVPGCSEFK